MPRAIGGGYIPRPLPPPEFRRQFWRAEIERERGCGRRFGCFTGFNVAGVTLVEEERADLVVYSTQILAEPGPVQDTWESPQSGQQVELSTSEAVPQDREVTFATDATVEPPPEKVKVEPATYLVATKTLRFRSSPSVSSDNNIIGYFSKDEAVEVMGRTPDGEWALVGDDGVVVGYAKFKDKGKDLLETPHEALEAARKKRAKPLIYARKPDGAVDLSSKANIRVAATPKTTTVLASTQCKSITASRGGKTDTKTGCQQPDSGWDIG